MPGRYFGADAGAGGIYIELGRTDMVVVVMVACRWSLGLGQQHRGRFTLCGEVRLSQAEDLQAWHRQQSARDFTRKHSSATPRINVSK
jgi:hypothetical protein